MNNKNIFTIGKANQENSHELASIIAQSLHFYKKSVQTLIEERIGYDCFRTIKKDNKLIGGLGILKMGQWFGGKRIPCAGLSFAGVSPEERRTGAASFILRKTLEELRQDGFPISMLFPTADLIYQKVGYERAGVRLMHEVRTTDIHISNRNAQMVRVNTDDPLEFVSLYRKMASQNNGHLDRHNYLWDKYIVSRLLPLNCNDYLSHDDIYRYYVVENGEKTGYVVYTVRDRGEIIQILDHCVLTRTAGERILTFFEDFVSISSILRWQSGQQGLLYSLLPQESIETTWSLEWMLRIIDVRKALEYRGYPMALEKELNIEVLDEILPENKGKYLLSVSNGKGNVSKGRKDGLKIDIRGLAPLFTGRYTASQLRILGFIEGNDEDISLVETMFSGSIPWMQDMF